MNLAENLSRSAATRPEAQAVKLDEAVLSYAALDEASARVAGLLAARGVAAGDRVGIMLPDVPYFPVVYYGILRRGAVAVPMNVLLKGRETAFYLKDPGGKVVFAWADFAEHARTGAAAAGAECIEVRPRLLAGGLCVRRRLAAGGVDAGVRGALRVHHPRGLRVERDVPGGVVQPPRPAAQARFDPDADRGRGDEGDLRCTGGSADRRGGGDRHPRTQRDEGVLQSARSDGRGDRRRRLVSQRRPGQGGRRRLLLHRRSQEGPDHPGGYNVYPREIEEVLYEHPAVREAAVVRMAHPELGEEVAAAIALKAGACATAADLRAFVKDQVAAYKYPRHVWIVDELPNGPTGRILKRQIDAHVEANAP